MSTSSRKSKLKNRLLLLLHTIIVVVVAYGVGTFIPNDFAKNKIAEQVEYYYQDWAINMGLNEPSFEYNNEAQFVRAMYKCIDFVNFTTPKEDRIPYEMIIGMASLETGYGTSRFATEANNLFGIRTYNQKIPHVLIESKKKWAGWGLRKFETKCQSVRYLVDLLNTHYAYVDFRNKRKQMQREGQDLETKELLETLTNVFHTTPDYTSRVLRQVEKIKTIISAEDVML